MLVWLTFLIVLLATGLVATVSAALRAQDGYEDALGFHPTSDPTRDRLALAAGGDQHSPAA